MAVVAARQPHVREPREVAQHGLGRGGVPDVREATAASVAHAGVAQSKSSPTAQTLMRRIAAPCHCGPNEAAQPIRATRIALVRPGLQQLAS